MKTYTKWHNDLCWQMSASFLSWALPLACEVRRGRLWIALGPLHFSVMTRAYYRKRLGDV